MYHRKAQGWMKHADFLLIDVISLHFALIIAYFWRHGSWMYGNPDFLKYSLLISFCDIFISVSFNSLHNVLKRGYYIEFKETLRHSIKVFILTVLFLYVMKFSERYSRIVLFATLFIYNMLAYASRVCWKRFLLHFRMPEKRKRRILALLDLNTAQKILTQIEHNPANNFTVTGIILTEKSDIKEFNGIPVVACLDEAADYICQAPVDSVFFGCPITSPNVDWFIEACMQMAIPVHYYMTAFYGEGVKYCTETIGRTKVLTTSLNYVTAGERIAKRLLDIAGGLIGSIAALFIMLIVGPFIKKASPGPILYTQERIGLNGRRFKMYKIRSMYPDADKRKKELMAQNRIADGRMFKLEFDPRVIGNEILPDGSVKTGIGDFIRRTSLDEFPQFFNVLMGQMSLVGTRPPTVDEWETYNYHHRARMSCKPGITGMWQVSGRSGITDFEEVVRLDTRYISNWNIGMDLRILLKTFTVVFERKGAF